MQIQGSKLSSSFNTTSKNETVIRKKEDQPRGQSSLSNDVKITNTAKSSGGKIKDAYGKSSYISYSENLKKQSNGMSAAAKNATDGAELIKTATDALQETQDVLKRMKEISEQATQTSLSQQDRQILQDELDNLSSSINDISKTTTFDGINLLDGDGQTKVYRNTDVSEFDETEIIETKIPASFDDKGNAFYKYGEASALSKEDAMKELANGNSLYLNGAMEQSEFTGTLSGSPEENKTHEGQETYSIDLGSDKMVFSRIVLMQDDNRDGVYKSHTIKNSDLNINSNANTSVKEVVRKLQENTYFNDNFDISSEGHNITITAKDASKAYLASFDYKLKGSSNSYTPENQKLYSYQGTEALSFEEAKSRLDSGEKLYVDAYTPQQLAKNDTDYAYTPGKTIIQEVEKPEKEPVEEVVGESYKTLHFQLNAEGSKFASARIDRMDSDALGVTNLNIMNAKEAEKSGKKIDTAINQVNNQREYLSSIGGRLKEASSINDKNAHNAKEAQIIEAKSETKTAPSKDIYAELEQTILENANKTEEESLGILSTTQTKPE